MRNLIDLFETPNAIETPNIVLERVTDYEHPKPALRCDAILAYENGAKVGYLKFDYTDRDTIVKELPTLWSYSYHYTGISGNKEAFEKPYRDMTVDDVYNILYVIKLYHYLRIDHLKGRFSERGKEIFDQMGNVKSLLLPSDRDDLVPILQACEKTNRGKELVKQRDEFLSFFSKPFVSYVSTTANPSQGVMSDNAGRGIGSMMYRDAARWIVERGLEKGLYGSGTQSKSAEFIWEIFEKRGWVSTDGARRYLDPTKFS